MQTKFIIPAIIWLLLMPGFVISQRATNKNRGQLPSSFYSSTGRQHDSKLLRDQRNSTTSMIDNLENPEGTVVLDGDAKLQKTRETLDNYDEIVFSNNYVEMPFQIGNTRHFIPAFNYSPHHKFNTDVLLEYKSFLRQCVFQTGEVPASVKLMHVDKLESCAFFSYRSKSQVSSSYYYMARLNLACAWLPFLKDMDIYVCRKDN